jgi:hypothetical protein
MTKKIIIPVSLVLFLTAGCQNNDDQIRTYRVSKDTGTSMPMAGGSAPAPSPAPMMGSTPAPMMGGVPSGNSGSDMSSMGAGMGMQAAANPHEITWTLPSGWQEQPPSSMRVGSFLATASNGQKADISVVPLSGDAGGDLANINRWRGQINLDPITDAELPQMSEKITPAGRPMILVDFVSHDLEIDNKYPKRLVAAIYKQGTRSWFFKMTGEDKAIQEIKPAFLKFLKTLQFHANS